MVFCTAPRVTFPSLSSSCSSSCKEKNGYVHAMHAKAHIYTWWGRGALKNVSRKNSHSHWEELVWCGKITISLLVLSFFLLSQEVPLPTHAPPTSRGVKEATQCMIMMNDNGFSTNPAGVRLAGGFPDRGVGVPRSSPSPQRCVCWGLVLGEQGSEAEGKGSFGFHGRPVGEKMLQIRFQGPWAQHLTPLPVTSNLHTLRFCGQKCHLSCSSVLLSSSRTKLVLDQAKKNSKINKAMLNLMRHLFHGRHCSKSFKWLTNLIFSSDL